MANDPDLSPSQPETGNCNISDGFSVCTELPAHGPVHWDRRTRHEWFDDEALAVTPHSYAEQNTTKGPPS